MFKKLVALTLAALMLLNPMTAMAVSWNTVLSELKEYRSYDNGEDLKADVDEEGNVVVEGYGEGGYIENFYHSDEFKSYTFKGVIHFGGETFEVYVKQGGQSVLVNTDTAEVHISASNVTLGAEGGATVTVEGNSFGYGTDDQRVGEILIGEGAILATDEAHFHAHSAPLEVINQGTIDVGSMFVDSGDNGFVEFINENVVRVEDELGLHAGNEETEMSKDTSKIAFHNEGSLTAENFWTWAHMDAKVDVFNHEGATISMEVGAHENPNEGEEEGPSDVLLMTDAGGTVTLNNEGNIFGGATLVLGNEEEDWAAATGTGTINNTGTITDHVHAWVFDDAAASVTNSGMIDGGFESYAHNNASTSLLNTESGTMIGGVQIGGEGASGSLTNEGEMIGGEIAVAMDGNAKGTFVNNGTISDAERAHANAAGNAVVSFTNNGSIDAERLDLNAVHAGTLTGSNEGEIEVVWGYTGSADNADISFTNDGYIHTQENFDLNSGSWPEDEEYPGYNPANSSSASLINNGEMVMDRGFGGSLMENGSVTLTNSETGTMNAMTEGIHIGNSGYGVGSVTVVNEGTVNSAWFNVSSQLRGDATIINSGTIHGEMGGFADGVYDDEGNLIEENQGGKMTIINSGTVENIYGNAYGEASIEASNTGTVTGEVWIDTAGNGTGTVTNDGEVGYKFGATADGDSKITLTNNNIVGDGEQNYDEEGNELAIDGIWGHGVGNGSITVVNNGYIIGEVGGGAHDDSTTTVTNNGKADVAYIEASGNGNLTATNEGIIVGDFEAYSFGESTIEMTNNALVGKDIAMMLMAAAEDTAAKAGEETVGSMIAFAEEKGSIKMENAQDAVVAGAMETVATGEAKTETTNTGVVTEIIVETTDKASSETKNAGTVEGTVQTKTSGEATSAVTNEAGATAGAITTTTTDNATSETKNAGTVAGAVETTASGTATTTVTNEAGATAGAITTTTTGSATSEAKNAGTVEGKMETVTKDNATSTVTNEAGATVTEMKNVTTDNAASGVKNDGAVGTLTSDMSASSNMTVAGEGKVDKATISITASNNEVISEEKMAQILDKVSLPKDTEIGSVTAYGEDGKATARYEVDKSGKVTMVEKYVQDVGGYDDPATWTKERIRHHKEEERKAAAIGGVYGSPFWLKQLYLGFMSLNLRLFSGEDQLLFKESLSWIPGTSDKLLTLRVKLEDTSSLMMRLDGAVIDKLEQAGITKITIIDGTGSVFMEYDVADLKDARAMYELGYEDYIVVGNADAEVMKIGADGEIVPIEGEQAEEVAEEANKEAAEEAVEETPAA